jgi:O-antigen/teichoic acid export membrane protein
MSLSTDKAHPNPVRNVSIVSLHKAAQMVGQVVAIATIPRLLGADDHGRFAFVLSLVYLGQILGDFGTLEVMSRFVPNLGLAEVKRLYMRTLAFKSVAGIVCGLISVGAALALSQWMRLDWAILIGLGVAAHLVAWVPFQVLLGLNQIGLWMVEQSWRQWVLVVLVLVLYPWLGLDGAFLAWTLMEIIFVVLGLWWARAYWQMSEFKLTRGYLWPYIRFGLGFFLANLIGAALYRSGPVLVETLTGQSAQAGYLSLAIGLFLTPYLLLTQLAHSFTPTLSRFYAKGQLAEMRQWVQGFVRYSWLVGWLGVVVIWLTVDWAVVFVFGADYRLAAEPLKWISLGIPMSGLLWAGNAVVTVTGRGRLKFGVSLVTVAVFLAITLWLTPVYLAAGAAFALSVAIVVNSALLIFFLQPQFTLEWPVLLASGTMGSLILLAIVNYELSVINWGVF